MRQLTCLDDFVCDCTANTTSTNASSDQIKKLRKELQGAAKKTLIKQIHSNKGTTIV